MKRRPSNLLPASSEVLKPNPVDHWQVKKQLDHQKQRQKLYYDQQKGIKELEPLSVGQNVRISPNPNSNNSGKWTPGVVTEKHHKPRSYIVQSENCLYRHNRKHLRRTSEAAKDMKHVLDDWYQTPNNTEWLPTPENRTEQEAMSTPLSANNVLQPKPLTPDKPKSPNGKYLTRSGRTVNKPTKFNI